MSRMRRRSKRQSRFDFALVLSVLSLVTLSGYPFDPKQLLLVEMIVIGLASVMLTVEPNFKRASGSYISVVLKKSIPNAIVMLAPVFVTQVIGKSDSFSDVSVNAICTVAVTVAASMSFATPFSTPPNALVMPAGQYSFMDFIRVGLPLQIIMGIVMIIVLPLVFGL